MKWFEIIPPSSAIHLHYKNLNSSIFIFSGSLDGGTIYFKRTECFYLVSAIHCLAFFTALCTPSAVFVQTFLPFLNSKTSRLWFTVVFKTQLYHPCVSFPPVCMHFRRPLFYTATQIFEQRERLLTNTAFNHFARPPLLS